MSDDSTTTQAALSNAESNERIKERLEREHRELLEELRALIPGAEVLFGLLIAVRFTQQFSALTSQQTNVYYVALIATVTALVLFVAPAVHHRIGFRQGDKDYVVRKGNHEAIAGSGAMAVAFTAAVHLVTDLVFGTVPAYIAAASLFVLIVWRWWALAIRRRAMK
jgi:hypothetical protein